MTTTLVGEVAAHGLPGQEAPLREEALSGSAWRSLVRTVDRQRLAGFLHAAIEAKRLPVTDDQQREADDLHLRWCAGALRLDRLLLHLAAALEDEGIEVVVLKGTAVAHLAYPDPALRSYGDVDLLFRSEQFDEALEVLYGQGYVRPAAPAGRDFDRRFGKGATLKGADGHELDVHRNLVFGTFGYAIELGELFASATTFHLGGRSLQALGPETRLLHACYHAALGDPDPRYSSIRDIAQMVATGTHDADRLLVLAERWQARAVLARGFWLCREHLGVELRGPLPRALDGYVPTRREQRAIDSYVGSNRHFAAKVVASLPYLDSNRDRAAFIWATAVPPSRFTRSRGSDPGVAWIRRGFRSLFRGHQR